MKKSRLVEQFDQDKERRLLGTHGAASEVRKIDPASIDATALVEQLSKEAKRWDRRTARNVPISAEVPEVRMSEPLGKFKGFRRFQGE
jgi:hypothetical protein